MGEDTCLCDVDYHCPIHGYPEAEEPERQPDDLSDYPYYAGTGACLSGCNEEPHCVTDEPIAGWPSGRRQRWGVRTGGSADASL
jgi:hypothetical protein